MFFECTLLLKKIWLLFAEKAYCVEGIKLVISPNIDQGDLAKAGSLKPVLRNYPCGPQKISPCHFKHTEMENQKTFSCVWFPNSAVISQPFTAVMYFVKNISMKTQHDTQWQWQLYTSPETSLVTCSKLWNIGRKWFFKKCYWCKMTKQCSGNTVHGLSDITTLRAHCFDGNITQTKCQNM